MDEDADLGTIYGLDKLFSEEVLRIIMTEPIDPTFFVNVEAELVTLHCLQILCRTCTVFEGGAGAGAGA